MTTSRNGCGCGSVIEYFDKVSASGNRDSIHRDPFLAVSVCVCFKQNRWAILFFDSSRQRSGHGLVVLYDGSIPWFDTELRRCNEYGVVACAVISVTGCVQSIFLDKLLAIC